MALENVIIYWTDNKNPPRHLTVAVPQGGGEDPYPQIRQDLNDLGVEFEDTMGFRFNITFTYTQGGTIPIMTLGEQGIFANLREGVRAILNDAQVLFRRKGVKSHFNYDVEAGTTFHETVRKDFTYTGCRIGGAHKVLNVRVKDELAGTNAQTLMPGPDASVNMFGRRTGGWVVHYPCYWGSGGDGSPSFRTATLSGIAILPLDEPYDVNPPFGRLALKKLWPQPEQNIFSITDYLGDNAYEQIDIPEAPTFKDYQRSSISGSSATTFGTIDLPASVAEGDLMVIAVATNARYPATISGWERIAETPYKGGVESRDDENLESQVVLFKKVAGASEPSAVMINWEGPQVWAAWAFNYSGADPDDIPRRLSTQVWQNRYFGISHVEDTYATSLGFSIACTRNRSGGMTIRKGFTHLLEDSISIDTPNGLIAGMSKTPLNSRHNEPIVPLSSVSVDFFYEEVPQHMSGITFGIQGVRAQ